MTRKEFALLGKNRRSRIRQAKRIRDSPDRREKVRLDLQAWLDVPIGLASLLFVLLAIVQLFGDVTAGQQQTLQVMILALWAFFALDLVVQLALSSNRLDYLRTHWLGVASTLIPVLGILRIAHFALFARFSSVIRLLYVGRRHSSHALRLLRRRQLGKLFVITMFVIPIFGVVEWLVETTHSNANIQTLGDGIWWAASTVTTIGAELYPVTVAGRIISFLLMLYAACVFTYLVASIASALIGSDREEDGGRRHAKESVLSAEDRRALRDIARKLHV